MSNRFVNPRPQYFDSSGNIVANGKAYFYINGTLTPKTTYADVNLTTPNAHPVRLTADGRMPNVFYEGTARMKLTTSDDVQIFDVNDVGVSGAGTSFGDWNNSTEYEIDSIVQASDRGYYRSLQNNNTGNDPTISPTFWELIRFIQDWNTNVTYGIDDIAQGSNGRLYVSLQSSNVANDPLSVPAYWADASRGTRKVTVVTSGATYNVVAADDIVCVNKSVGSATAVNLPAIGTTGRIIEIKDAKGDSTTNNITVTPNGAETIDGVATFVIGVNYSSITVVDNGTEWNVI